MRSVAWIALAAILLVPSLPTAAAEEPPWPTELTGTFQVRPLRAGDAGVYTYTAAQDDGSGFREVGETEDLMRFEWLKPVTRPTNFSPAELVNRVQITSNGWGVPKDPERPEINNVTEVIGLDGTGRGRLGEGGPLGENLVYWRDYFGRWGSIPCGAISSMHGHAIDLARDELTVNACAVRGFYVPNTLQPVARGKLGPFDAVAFHGARIGHTGETWLWYTPDVPLPIAMVLQDPDRPMRFGVVRLAQFREGQEELPSQAQAAPAWAAMGTQVYGRIPSSEPGWVNVTVRDMLDAAEASEGGSKVTSWLNDHPEAALVTHRVYTADNEPGHRDIRMDSFFQAEGSMLSVWYNLQDPDPATPQTPLLPVALPQPIQDIVDPPQPQDETYFDVSFAIDTCECSALPDDVVDVVAPSIEEVRHRWEKIRSPLADDLPPQYWAMTRHATGNGHDVDLDLTVGFGQTRMSADGASYVTKSSELELQFETADRPLDPPAMVLMEKFSSTPLPRPAAGKGPLSPLTGLTDPLGLLDLMREKGVLPNDEAPEGSPAGGQREAARIGDASIPSTGIGTASVAPPSKHTVSGKTVTVVAASGLGLAAIIAALWKFGALSLFSRIGADRLLEHPMRQQIMASIEARPGIHVSEICRVTGKSPGVVQHHLAKMVAADLVHRVAAGNVTSFFATGSTPREVRTATPALASAGRRQVLRAILDTPNASPGLVARNLGIAPGTVTHHVQALSEAGLVASSRVGSGTALNVTPLGVAAWENAAGAA